MQRELLSAAVVAAVGMWATLLRCPSCPQPGRRPRRRRRRTTPPSGSRSRAPDGDACCCTTQRRNAHRAGVERELLYPWHPWYGRSLWIHGVLVKSGRVVYRCSLEAQQEAPLLEIPQWMFESTGCCRVHRAENPFVDCVALADASSTSPRVLSDSSSKLMAFTQRRKPPSKLSRQSFRRNCAGGRSR